MSDPIGTPENPAGKGETAEQYEARMAETSAVAERALAVQRGAAMTGAPVVGTPYADDAGLPGEEVPEGSEGYDLRLDTGSGYVEYDLDSTHSTFNSLLEEAFDELGYGEAFTAWVKQGENWKVFTFEDDRTIDVRAALAAYNAFLVRNPLYEDRFVSVTEGGGAFGEPVQQAYGIDYRMFRDAMIDAIQSARGGGIAAEQARLEEEKKQTAYLEQIAAARPTETPLTLEGIKTFLGGWLQQGAPASGERSIEDFINRVLPKINFIGQAAVTANNLAQSYTRSAAAEASANQAYLAGDMRAFERYDTMAYRLGNRVDSNLMNLFNTLQSGSPGTLVKEAKAYQPYVKKAKVEKYKTYKTSAFAMSKATSKAIADKQSAKIKALEAKVKELTESFKKLKGVP